jgi:hypothetical protein
MKIYKKSLSDVNDLKFENWRESLKKIIDHLNNGKSSPEQLYRFLGLLDNSYLQKMGLPSFIQDITKVYDLGKKRDIEVSQEKRKPLYPPQN